MSKRHLAFAAVAASLFLPGAAMALEPSSRDKPFYIEGAVPIGFDGGGFGYGVGCGRGGCFGGHWKPDLELGFHFTGRHDGFVLGFRHVFYIGGTSGMGALLRIGYDIPIPLKGGKYELTIGPYGYVGGSFLGCNGCSTEGAFQTGGGVEGKFFILKGFYVFARPLDFGVMYFPDFSNAYFQWMFGAGAGYAW